MVGIYLKIYFGHIFTSFYVKEGLYMNIAVIDGQGAGIGRTIIRRICREINVDITIIALGTNKVAMDNMLGAGAHRGLHGENAICEFLTDECIDTLIGPIGILCSGGIKGEITPKIAHAVFHADCTKYILPLKAHGLYIPGTRHLEIREFIDEIISDIKKGA